MIAENIELKQVFTLNSYPFADRSLKLGCHRSVKESSRYDCGQRLTMSLVGSPMFTIGEGGGRLRIRRHRCD